MLILEDRGEQSFVALLLIEGEGRVLLVYGVVCQMGECVVQVALTRFIKY